MTKKAQETEKCQGPKVESQASSEREHKSKETAFYSVALEEACGDLGRILDFFLSLSTVRPVAEGTTCMVAHLGARM